jgi:UDP-N-acetylglucosamine--dolichyl-phosphate N-acetylglucosaminephosphotransferase
MFLLALVLFALSFFITFLVTKFLIKQVPKTRFVGRDWHKKGKPKVPELGGIGIISGIVISILFLIAANSFATLKIIFDGGLNVIYILAVLGVVLMAALIGLIDDVLGLRQLYKFLIPFLIALPLTAVKVSALHGFSIFGIEINPWIYELILIPIGICAATNLTNTFAGFNGLEAGLGAVASFFLILMGIQANNGYVIFLSVILFSSLLAFLFFNWYPAKIFPDDIGTLPIGAMIASIVILGGIEIKGVILLLPHIIDFLFFKLPNGLPRGWDGELRGKKLYCKGKPVQFAHFIIKVFNGIEEKNLVLFFIGLEVVLGFVAVFVG